MILETSVQAGFLIPMAIGLGFGILFATVISLMIMPSRYWVGHGIVVYGRESLNDFATAAVGKKMILKLT